jgi:hypothetical protein
MDLFNNIHNDLKHIKKNVNMLEQYNNVCLT